MPPLPLEERFTVAVGIGCGSLLFVTLDSAGAEPAADRVILTVFRAAVAEPVPPPAAVLATVS